MLHCDNELPPVTVNVPLTPASNGPQLTSA
jgi:hypothetical protein